MTIQTGDCRPLPFRPIAREHISILCRIVHRYPDRSHRSYSGCEWGPETDFSGSTGIGYNNVSLLNQIPIIDVANLIEPSTVCTDDFIKAENHLPHVSPEMDSLSLQGEIGYYVCGVRSR